MISWNVFHGLFFQNNALFVNVYRWFLLLKTMAVNFGLVPADCGYKARLIKHLKITIGMNFLLFAVVLVLKTVETPHIFMAQRLVQTIGVHSGIILYYILIYKRLNDLKQHSPYIQYLQRSTLLFLFFVVQYLVAQTVFQMVTQVNSAE